MISREPASLMQLMQLMPPIQFGGSGSRYFAMLGAGLLAALLVLPARAQAPATATPPPAAASPSAIAPTILPRSTWANLTPSQQQALKPLELSWDISMSDQHRRKWLELSKNYSSLSPDDQATLHSRMNEWIALSPQQRAAARLNFAKTKELSKQLTREEKKANWETYQALSPEEKQKLAAKASTKPVGAATAVKPVSPQKLAPVSPNPRPTSKPALKIQQAQPMGAAPPAGPPQSGAAGGAPGNAASR